MFSRFAVHMFTVGCFLLGHLAAHSQTFYFTGAFVDSKAKPVAFVKIKPYSSQLSYSAGNTGEFGINSFIKKDSAFCFVEGYDTLKISMEHGKFQRYILTMEKSYAERLIRQSRLSSLVKSNNSFAVKTESTLSGGESYHELVENSFVDAANYPSTGFMPNNNRSSFSNIRRFVKQGSRVPPNAIRLEELWNYAPLNITGNSAKNEIFSTAIQLSECPWKEGNLLLMVNAVAKKINVDSLPPVNMVFLIDNSGSMEDASRLPLLKSGFKKMVEHMRPKDRVGIVTYGGAAGIYLRPTFGNDKQKILNAIDSLEAGGSTPGSNGIQLAYELVTTNSFTNGINRVILATDGDFNVGLIDEKELETLIERYRSTGVTLSCFGVGMGNYKDSKIEVLARLGSGAFAYIDSDEEAEKIMAHQITAGLFVVANDATMQLNFNKDAVKNYKLIGYDNKIEALNVQANKLVGAEVGSGQSIVAMVEIEPVKNLPFYTTANLGSWQLTWKLQGGDSTQRKEVNLSAENIPLLQTDSSFRVAAALAWYGKVMRDIAAPAGSLAGPEALAISAIHPDNNERMNLLKLISASRKVYEPPTEEKKGKRKKTKATSE